MFSQIDEAMVEEQGDDIVHVTPLQELSMELLDESLKYQISHPFTSKTNFIEEFNETYAMDLDTFDGNDDVTAETKEIARNFYLSVLNMLDDKFGLHLDHEIVDEMNVDGIKNLAEGLYEFFILKYANNIGKYITDMIIENKDDLIDRYHGNDNDTVSWISFSRKLKDPEMVPIFANISSIIKEFKDMEISPDDFIEYFNKDKFEVAVLEYAILNFVILGDFVQNFLEPLFGYETQNDIYDELIVNVSERLFRKFRKNKLPTIEEIKKITVGEDEDGAK